MIDIANQDGAGCDLALEMAFETEILVPLFEQLGVDGAMHGMARGATFPHRLMFKDKRPGLGRMALKANLLLVQQRRSARWQGRAAVRVVAIAAGDLAFEHRVPVRQVELAPLVQVALEADLGRLAGIHNGVGVSATLRVEAARAVARFAPHIGRVGSRSQQTRVRGRGEELRHWLVAGRTLLRAHERGPRNLRRRHQRFVESAAGNRHQQDEAKGEPSYEPFLGSPDHNSQISSDWDR